METERTFVVADSRSGIPYREQTYMTKEECEAWIDRDVKQCNKLGIPVTREDYEIKDMSKFI